MIVVPYSGAIQLGKIHGVAVQLGVCDGVAVVEPVHVDVGVPVGEPVAVAVLDGDDVGVTGGVSDPEGDVPNDTDAEADPVPDGVCVAVDVGVGVCDGVDDWLGATHSVPGCTGFAEQFTLIVSAYRHAGDSEPVCDMYVAPPPTVEHANVSAVERCCPDSVVEQPLAYSPPVYICFDSWKPLAHAAFAVHAAHPAPVPVYTPVDVVAPEPDDWSTAMNGHTS